MICKIPNFLTLLRILMAFALLQLLIVAPELRMDWGLGLFVVAMATDFLDGYLARKLDCITPFGKVMDPLADKMMVFAALLGLAAHDLAPIWPIYLILFREFLISGLRILAAGSGLDVSASLWGKAKTVLQTLAIIALLLALPGAVWLLWLAAIVTLLSGWIYLRAYSREVAWA